MSIPVYQVKSTLSQVSEESILQYFASLNRHLSETFVRADIGEVKNAPVQFVFVASGGSEGLFLSQCSSLFDRPIYILTSGQSNSLAASMEILAYLQNRGCAGEILHGDADSIARRVDALYRSARARNAFRGKRFGLIGTPSDWLIASADEDSAWREKLGCSLTRIPMEELLFEIKIGGYPKNKWSDALLSMGYDETEMQKALGVYGALRRIVDKYALSGITVRCFDLLDTVYTTGCLGLAILNAEGVYAGCEGDVPALISMAILGEISQNPVFLCNPSRIDTENGFMVLAHCTLPINMPYEMRLTTHYESGIGVAIAGNLPEEEITIFKASTDLKRHFVKSGWIIENLHEPTLCRTQIRIKLDDFSYFLKNPIQNHHLICLGDHVRAVEAFFEGC